MPQRISWHLAIVVALSLSGPPSLSVLAQDEPATDADSQAATQPDQPQDPEGLVRIEPGSMAWLDAKNKRIVMVGEVCLREGPLEMFACQKGTKEHESIVAIPVSAQAVHQALLLLGARPGGPVQFAPEYKPASGTEVDVSLFWTDENGQRQRAYAQDWIRNSRTGKAMDHPWVFGGSAFWEDDREPGKRYYMAEDGDFICVSNFASAMLDIPVPSSQSNDSLLFEAFSDRIPPLGAKVTVVLTPKLAAKQPADDATGSPDAAAASNEQPADSESSAGVE